VKRKCGIPRPKACAIALPVLIGQI